ncbi:MAG: YciI family protein [Burkholderiaceae bacterium]
MANYIFAFHGGAMPETPEEGAKVMAKWVAWMEGLGDAIAHPGAPVGQSHTVSAAGTKPDGGANPLSGFTLITADSLDSAIEMARGCPINEAGGSVEIAEMLPM